MSKEKRDKIISILQKHGVKKIYLFGSYARDETTPKSDLDLIVEFPSYISLLDHIAIENELSKALNIEIDLLSKKGISPYLKDEILKDAKLILG
ncbi:MAG: type VII toxin-antitoxin system MntA family adenylyltransferase antitoxin [Promethearchaeia archaeon]